MGKNIKLNNMEYNGVSTVQLPTADGGTATFKDVDEIVTPSGIKEITENGTFDVAEFAKVAVSVAASGGSGGAQGTFIGDGTNKIPSLSLPPSANFLIVYSDTFVAQGLDFDLSQYSAYTFLAGMWKKTSLSIIGGINFNATGLQAQIFQANISGWRVTWDDSGNFTDENVKTAVAVKTIEGETYHWVAY